MTLAIIVRDAVDTMSTFDDTGNVTQDQILEIAGDLDSWNQDQDGLVELQYADHQNQARLSEIIQERTGLGYQQAPKFFDKMNSIFLDRSIPLLPGEAQAPLIAESVAGAGAAGGGLAAAGIAGGAAVSAESMAGMAGKSDLATIDRLIDALKVTETQWKSKVPLPSFGPRPLPSFGDAEYKLSEVRAFREGVEAFRAEVVTTSQFLEKEGEKAGREVLGHEKLGAERTILAFRCRTLREMVSYFNRNNEVRPGDVETLKLFVRTNQSVNARVAQWLANAATMPRALSTTRMAAMPVAANLRQIAQPLKMFSQRLGFARGTAVGAAVLAGAGLLYLGFEATASALSKEDKQRAGARK